MGVLASDLNNSLVWIVGDVAMAFFQLLQTAWQRSRMTPAGRTERMASSSSAVFRTASHAVVGVVMEGVVSVVAASS